jgi:hypothetical protein
MIDTEELPVEDTDTEQMRVRVITEGGTNDRRVYEIGIDPTGMVDGAYVMHGRRVDDGAPEEVGGSVSDNAWDAAAERFKDAGYEVFGR